MATFVESELHYYDTWRNCSLDTSHSESMVEDDRVVVNFDKVKTAYLNDLGKSEEKMKTEIYTWLNLKMATLQKQIFEEKLWTVF